MNIFLVNEIKTYLEFSLDKWSSFYGKDKSLDKSSLPSATYFLINCLDESINLVEGVFVDGKDKKAAVLLIIAYLFDKIILNNLPIYLKPFSFLIKLFIVQILSSVLIDFIVAKYNSGSWQNKEEK